jgi:NAD-dependent DNA ligase
MQIIQAPTSCPSCGSVLDVVNNLLFCRNTSCTSQTHKRLEHFAKTLKIKGLGPKAIQKLRVTTSRELYLLTLDDLVLLLESEKIGAKVFAEIQKSRGVPMNVVLPALSIPLIGNTAAKKLSAVCDGLGDIEPETCAEAGLGPKATENLLQYLAAHGHELLQHPFSFKFEKPIAVANKGVVCISGKLKSYKTKAEATEMLQQQGYTVKGSLTRDVTILVNESGIESAKTKSARDKGIQIINNLLDFLEK